MRLISEANNTDHWTKKHRRKKHLKCIITTLWLANPELRNLNLPIHIEFIRKGPRSCDYDNLVISFKNIRDTCSDLLIPGLAAGRADDSDLLSFAWSQEKAKEYSVEIIFTEKKT